MEYGFSNAVAQKRPFPVSDCVSNVYLRSATYGVHGEYQYIDMVFTQETEDEIAELRERFFAVNPNNITPSSHIQNDTKEEAVKRELIKFVSRLKHIATKLQITEDELKSIPEGSFKTFAEAYCSLVMQRGTKTALYCKTVRDKNGWPKLAKYPPFLQRMDSGKCELSYTATELSALANSAGNNGVAAKETRVGDWV